MSGRSDTADDLSERDRFLLNLRTLAEKAGITRELPLSGSIHFWLQGEQRLYAWDYEDWRGRGTLGRRTDPEDLMEKMLLEATAETAKEQVARSPEQGKSPSERAFDLQVELMRRIRPAWGDRLESRRAEVLRLPGWRKL